MYLHFFSKSSDNELKLCSTNNIGEVIKILVIIQMSRGMNSMYQYFDAIKSIIGQWY